MDELIEYLRTASENANLPMTMRDRLEEAAAALEAAREDSARLEWLESNSVEAADEYGTGSQLYFGTYATAPLRAAIDQARGKWGFANGGAE